MAKKGMAKWAVAALKKILGAEGGLFAVLKATGKAIARGLGKLKALSPTDLAYRLRVKMGDVRPGYVVRSDRWRISGVAFPSADGKPAEVILLVNSVAINRTYATQKASEPSLYRDRCVSFNFPMKRVWEKLPRADSITVTANGAALGYGARSAPVIPNHGSKNVTGPDIKELVAQGRLINKFGRIQPPRDLSQAWADKALGNYERLQAAFEREFDKRLYVFYGAMLGFAREGGILAHDLDLDLAYFSEEQSPQAVKAEFYSIAERLGRLGLGARADTYKITFPGSGLSVTPTWIADGVFASTFGYVGDGFSVTRDDLVPLSRAEHLGHSLYLPRNPKAVAAYVYGKGWLYPDPGWKWLPEYKDRPNVLAARLSDAEVRRLNTAAVAP